MIAKLPNDVNGNPIQALIPINGVNKADTETWVNTSKSEIVRVCPVDADAVIIISEDGTTSGDGTFMAQGLPEYLHIPRVHTSLGEQGSSYRISCSHRD